MRRAPPSSSQLAVALKVQNTGQIPCDAFWTIRSSSCLRCDVDLSPAILALHQSAEAVRGESRQSSWVLCSVLLACFQCLRPVQSSGEVCAHCVESSHGQTPCSAARITVARVEGEFVVRRLQRAPQSRLCNDRCKCRPRTSSGLGQLVLSMSAETHGW